jgi:hypothetical protein
MNIAKGLCSTTNNSPPAGTKQRYDNNISSKYYKKFLSERNFFCMCSTCLSIGPELISLQYRNSHNILIEDQSKRIFDPFLEKEVRY